MICVNELRRIWSVLFVLLGLAIAGCGGQPQPKINDKPVPLPSGPSAVPTPSSPTAPAKP